MSFGPRKLAPPGFQMSRRYFWVTFIGAYVFVVAHLLVLNNESLFYRSVIEQGDIASDALVIRDAKALARFTGHYSKFGFNHPGPAFFYVYAAGEYVFHDLLQLSPSPHNAHVLTGLLLQAAFFSLALALYAGWARAPLFPPLALLLCCVFSAVLNSDMSGTSLRGSMFLGQWPPHWTLFTALAYLVACVSLSAGSAAALLVVIFCGSMLVHGYVTMPVFVLPTSLLAYVLFLYIRWTRFGQRPLDAVKSTWRMHGAGALLLLIFIFPLLVDLSQGENSNLARIWWETQKHSGTIHSPSDALAYVANYFTLLRHGKDFLVHIEPNAWAYLASQWPLLLCWTVAAMAVPAMAVGLRKRIGPCLQYHAVMTSLFTAVWLVIALWYATRTIGDLSFYSSLHIFALQFLIIIVLSAILASLIRQYQPVSIGLAVVMLAFLLALPAVPAYRKAMAEYSWRLDLRESIAPVKGLDIFVDEILSERPRRPAGVVLDLMRKREDGSVHLTNPHTSFILSISIGLLLEREGIPVRVHSSRGYVFGARRILDPGQLDDPAVSHYEVWRIASLEEAEADPVEPLWQEIGDTNVYLSVAVPN